MVDVLGTRKVMAVIGPSTNTIVQPDMDGMRPAGVTNQYRHIYVEDPEALSDEAFMAGTASISEGVRPALQAVATMGPDYVVMGISAISFYGGIKAAETLVKDIEAITGCKSSVGSLALAAAIRSYGDHVRRIAFVSPYYPVANVHVAGFLKESGFEVVKDVALKCTSWTNIAKVPEARLREVIKDLNGDDVDAICQVGTNLSMCRLAAEAEQWLGKPVIAINTATYWHALRACGIDDRIEGFGPLLSER